MKIANKKKFIRSSILFFICMMMFIWFWFNSSYSKENIQYKEDYIVQGDTLWSIAENQVNTNEYYKGQDIRKVMYEIKKLNNIQDKNLSIGQKIIIPCI